jgi:hypothetical protein
MRKVMVTTIVMLLLIPLVLVAASCGGTDTKEAETNLCKSLNDFEAALIALGDISLDSTVEDIQNNYKAVEDAWNKVVADTENVGTARSDDLKKAYDNLDKAIDDIPGDATVTEALQSIADEAAAVVAAWEQLFNDLDCDALLSEE